MDFKQGPLRGSADVHILYTLGPEESRTHVIRKLDIAIEIPGLLRLAEPFVARAFRKENVRIMAELKRYVEAESKARTFVSS